MNRRILKVTLIALFVNLVLKNVTSQNQGKVVMPWMCLERCNENIKFDLSQIKAHTKEINTVSFEAYNLGENGTLIWNGFTEVNNDLQGFGVERYAMITSVNINHIRYLFAHSEEFIKMAIDEALKHNYSGYNVDFECTGGNDIDASYFTSFIDLFAVSLHKHGIKVSVDVGRELQVCPTKNSPWDFQSLALTNVDKVITMDTYATSRRVFEEGLEYAIYNIGIQKLGIGLSTVDLFTNETFSYFEMEWRFELLQRFNIQEVDIWQAPLPQFWFPLLDEFIQYSSK